MRKINKIEHQQSFFANDGQIIDIIIKGYYLFFLSRSQ